MAKIRLSWAVGPIGRSGFTARHQASAAAHRAASGSASHGARLIANGVAPFIDGRTELYGKKFFVEHNAASGLMEPENLFRLLDQYKIEATLMRTQSAATKLLDHLDGWQKVYADDIATIQGRQAGAAHTAEPAVDPAAR